MKSISAKGIANHAKRWAVQRNSFIAYLTIRAGLPVLALALLISTFFTGVPPTGRWPWLFWLNKWLVAIYLFGQSIESIYSAAKEWRERK